MDSFKACAFALLFSVISGCGHSDSGQDDASGAAAPLDASVGPVDALSTADGSSPALLGLVSVSGANIYRDGARWIPHGFYQIAFEAPPGFLASEKNGFWATAQNDFTAAEYTQMRQFGADSVRMQVAQTGIDPQGLYYSAAYSQKAADAVKAARAAGLTVIISVQDEAQTGETNPLYLPGPATQRVWQQLAPPFAADRGVVFELFNEPTIGAFKEEPPAAADWSTWAQAMNATIATIRGLGAQNVVVADGLMLAEELTGAPTLSDPLQQVIYAAHPYAHNSNDQQEAAWDIKFGNFAKTAPVMISEWGIGYYCDDSTGTSSRDFLIYLQNHGIGIQAGTWDWAPLGFGSVIEGFPKNRITSFPPEGTALCNADAGDIRTLWGPGKLIQTWYSTGKPSTELE